MGKQITLIVGRSASGKSSVVKYLEDNYGLSRVKSYTTRPPRNNEKVNSVDHIFVDDKEFDRIMNEEKPIAYTKYGDYRYCATQNQIENSDLYIIDPQGVLYMNNFYNGNKNVKVVYIDTDLHVCYNRLINEGCSHEDAIIRLMRNQDDYANYIDYDIKIDGNGNVENVAEMTMEYILTNGGA